MLGKLTWAAIPFHEPLPLVSAAVVGLVLLGTERGALAAELGSGLYLAAAVGSAGAALWLILRSRASYREAGIAILQAPP